MPIARRALVTAVALFALALLPQGVVAQDHADEGGDGVSTFGEDFPHGVTFWTRREPDGCTLCAPSIDINGGFFMQQQDPIDISTGFFRLHTQWGLGIKHIAMSADLLWRSGSGGSSAVLMAQYEPISQRSRFYLSAGGGLIDDDGGFWPWVQATAAYRSPIHDLAPFVMVGKVPGDDAGINHNAQLYLGVAHPLAPYKMHGLH